MYGSTIFYSIVNFTYPIIRLHVSTVCQSRAYTNFIPYALLHKAFCIRPEDD